MAYATQAQLEARFAGLQWWTDDAAAGAIDAAIVTEVIRQVDGVINRYASRQYEVPLALSDEATAGMINSCACDIAGWMLASRPREGAIPENMKALYDAAIKWLEALAKGDVTLAGETELAGRPAIGVITKGGTARVDHDSMKGW